MNLRNTNFLILIFAFIISLPFASAQEQKAPKMEKLERADSDDGPVPHIRAKKSTMVGKTEQPRFPGCELEADERAKYSCSSQALLQHIYSRLKYPPVARSKRIEGTVVVRFYVETDGQLTDFEVVREIGEGCGAEAMRVLKTMPNWVPGKQDGVPARMPFSMPVRYKLE